MRYLLLFLFLLLTPSSASAVWFDSNWDYRVKVEIAPSQVVSDVTSFPVYVDLGTLPDSFFTNASTTGADVRVTKSDGTTEVAFELVSMGTRVTTSIIDIIETSTTTYQLSPYALNPIKVEAWGGGGGGGDGTNTGGGGGGGGAYASSSLTLATSTNYAIVVGTGGAKGAAGARGSNGATTTFDGTQVLAAGGYGGNGCSAVNCSGGSGGPASISIGTNRFSGGNAGDGANTGDLGGGGGEAAGSSGTGTFGSGQTAGASAASGGDGGAGGANGGSGANGNIPGGGGGGGENNSVGATGNGADGQVVISYNIATTTELIGELHFLADSLSTTSSSTFYIYYGNPSASAYAVSDTYGRNNVWANYVAVWHMQETSGDPVSSTGDNTLTENNTVPSAYGRMLNARDLVRSGSDYFSIVSGSQTDLGITGNAITLSTWIKGNSGLTGNIGRIIWRLGGTGSYGYQLSTTGTTYTPNNAYLVSGVGTGGGTDFAFGTAGDATSNSLKHVVATYDGDVFNGYVNTSKTTSASGLTNRLTNANAISFYVGADPSNFYDDVLDEVRISSVVKTDGWIGTEYNNQSSPATFYWVGAEETEGAPPAGDSTDSGVIWFD